MITQKTKFNEWMCKKVQSLHYSNNERMVNAYDRIIEFNDVIKNK